MSTILFRWPMHAEAYSLKRHTHGVKILIFMYQVIIHLVSVLGAECFLYNPCTQSFLYNPCKVCEDFLDQELWWKRAKLNLPWKTRAKPRASRAKWRASSAKGERLVQRGERLGPITRSMAKRIHEDLDQATDGRESYLYMLHEGPSRVA